MIVLGLAVATCEHHAAALVIDGQIVGAAEEERFNGVKHYGWTPEGRPGANLVNTPGLTLTDARCRGAAGWLLRSRGLSPSDVDVIAVNAIPHRFLGAREPVRAGRYLFVPHHLAHAALAARTSPYGECNVLTVDGRGEYETAAWFTYRGGALRRRAELPAGEGRSIGGAYETVTRVLGLGAHGQGQTMALAALGRADAGRLAAAYRIGGFEDFVLDEAALERLARERVGPAPQHDTPAARDLAADVQAATEEAVVALAREGQAAAPCGRWAIAGGVALNCRANSVLRDALGVELWVPSAAHDGGTALGAALEAAHVLGEPTCEAVWTAGWGPEASADEVSEALAEAGLRATLRGPEVPSEAAGRLARGQVLGWVQGRLEYGPRALGHRSIVAHPGHPGIQDRVNQIKARQRWRPFGPSVLAERYGEWLEGPAAGPFMTFTADVRPERRHQVAGVVHADGSTRPQMVDGRSEPAWRALLERFDALTGIPMVLNTSFNGRGEPIVRGPAEAIASARRLGLDVLVLGDALVDLAG
jgi:predicted NodU family carbamoyl transferase